MLEKHKQLKDPIYGYISIPNSLIEGIVDTAEFQRLRDIVQTSYAPLYSSAVHNRFVHSLGVYYLGTIVSKTIADNCKEKKISVPKMARYLGIFELACLLHDLGHAPFSHTGEDFYLNKNGDRAELHNEIDSLINDKYFLNEIASGKDYKAAPHELMSVIVALKKYDSLFETDEEKSFFARCIIGYNYKIKLNKTRSFLNCIISLLNSSVIDVDKLDYLIRDAYITGYDTVAIDYKRLLSNIEIIEDNDNCKLVYKKGAISVIENVVYARDSEKKWIQAHPIVVYESFLLRTAIKELQSKYSKANLFSYQALSSDGIRISKNFRISLLSDSDLIFLMKNTNSASVKEYFSRVERRHPLWKSESEYKAIFNQGFNDNDYIIVVRTLTEICKLCGSEIINDDSIKKCKKEINSTRDLLKKMPQKAVEIEKNVKIKERYLKWLLEIRKFAVEQKIDFDFVVLNTKQFISGFSNIGFEEIEINFEAIGKPNLFKDVTNVLKADDDEKSSFFYIYCRRSGLTNMVDVNKLAYVLGELARGESLEEMKIGFNQ